MDTGRSCSILIFLSFSVVRSFHDWRLNDRHQGHIRICCHSDGSHQCCLSQFTCQEDRGRAVSSTDDGDCCCCFSIESQEDCQEIRSCRYRAVLQHQEENSSGWRSAGPKSVIAPTPMKIRDGRILHSSRMIEVMQKTTGMFDTHSIYIRICHNIRIDVNQQHTECDRHQQQWLKVRV